MGWEWHDRARSRKGRWSETHKSDQIHAYCLPCQGEAIRNAARKRAMQVDNFVIECCMRCITEDGQIEVSTERNTADGARGPKARRGGHHRRLADDRRALAFRLDHRFHEAAGQGQPAEGRPTIHRFAPWHLPPRGHWRRGKRTDGRSRRKRAPPTLNGAPAYRAVAANLKRKPSGAGRDKGSEAAPAALDPCGTRTARALVPPATSERAHRRAGKPGNDFAKAAFCARRSP